MTSAEAEEYHDVQKILLECVHESLNQLGPSVAELVCSHLENAFGMKQEEILNRPRALFRALHSIISDGANVIERLSMQKIREKKRHLHRIGKNKASSKGKRIKP